MPSESSLEVGVPVRRYEAKPDRDFLGWELYTNATHYNNLKELWETKIPHDSTLMANVGAFFLLQEYFQNHHGDWLAVDFKAAKERDELSKHFKVEGIPSFLADFGQT